MRPAATTSEDDEAGVAQEVLGQAEALSSDDPTRVTTLKLRTSPATTA